MQDTTVAATMVSYPDNISGAQPGNTGPTDQATFEADKRAVYKHPLFPLLALLFERCEQATQSAETPNSESFNLDIQAFVQHQERDRKPFLVNDSEVDGLMIKAIQVLRIHLLELEKVQELCKDFCNRYITCLKGKMQSENLLRSDYATGYVENNNNNSSTNNNSSHSSDSNSPSAFTAHSLQVVSPTGYEGGLLTGSGVAVGGSAATMHVDDMVTHHYNSCSSQMVPATAVLVEQQLQQQHQHIVHGSTPLSQIGANPCPPPPPPSSDISLLQGGSLSATSGGSGDEDDDMFGSRKKQKRGVLPKQATSIMRSWLFQHLVHPYPTEDEKRQIAAQTNLTLLQVNNWFINARRRILQPMLDASSPADGVTGSNGQSSKASSGTACNKKTKSGANKQAPAQRFWPNNIARLSALDNTQDSSLLSVDDELESSCEEEEDLDEGGEGEGSCSDGGELGGAGNITTTPTSQQEDSEQ
ncbi:homeobox protein Meis1 [Nilaparvata lugens]|uniref:homeobox protein Meis1 n=1 Tax=Nilaparvata lugens TaxID=108931 RepID=UPI00193EA9D3|nr:homeobox protein Meis1 [Nilaparvata lugens]